MKKFLFISFLFIAGLSVAQQGIIKGSITNNNNIEIFIQLKNANSQGVVKSTFNEADGSFEFTKLKDGKYFIQISSLIFENYNSDTIVINGNSVYLNPIALQPISKTLENINIESKKRFVERKIDRVVINPDALIANTAQTALEVLEKSPGVNVDVNGNIALKGKQGVMVFIDDKPTQLSATNLANYLRTIAASSIEAVELMTNPPAKYDAAGNAGIINIRLKKIKTKGFNASLNVGLGTGRYLRSNNNVSLNYRINKFNFFSNFSFNQNNSYQDLDINREYFKPTGAFNSAFNQNTYFFKQQKSINGRIGFDYYINSKSTLGFVASGFSNPFYNAVNNKANILDSNKNIINKVVASNPSDKTWNNYNFNVNYNYKIDNKGTELTVNADYIQYNLTQQQILTNSLFTANDVLLSQSILESSLPASLKIQSAKIDYSHPFESGLKMDAGAKTSLVNTDNTANFFDVVNNISTPNYTFSNRFKYDERINAAYVNFSKDWSKISLQLGLRIENTRLTGNQLGNPTQKDSSFSRDYTNLFPTFYAVYRMDSLQKHQLVFSVGRRIDRPNYQDMNPFTYPLDRYTYYAGNPYLQPTFSYNYELQYLYNNWLTVGVEYSNTTNYIQETNEQRDNIFYSRPGNFRKQIVYGISVNAQLKPTKWWTINLYSEYKNMGYDAVIYNQLLNDNRFYWAIVPTNQFQISKTLTAEINASYQTSILAAQFLTIPVGSASIGFAQKLWKGKGTLKVSLADMFYTNQPGGDINNIANSKANWKSYLDSRVISVGLNYRFSKGKTLQARKVGASDEEKGRVKTN